MIAARGGARACHNHVLLLSPHPKLADGAVYRSVSSLHASDADHQQESTYSLLWYILHKMARVSPGPEDLRPTMKAAATAKTIL